MHGVTELLGVILGVQDHKKDPLQVYSSLAAKDLKNLLKDLV